MKFGRTLTLVAAILSAPSWAANLTVDKNIELEVINGKAYKSSRTFFGKAEDIALPTGDQQMVFRIFDSFRNGSSQDLFRSEYYVVTFADQGDSTINLAATPLTNLSAAKQFDKNPAFKLTNGKGENVPFKLAQLKKEGMQVSRDLVTELREFNATGNEAAIESRAPFAALALMNNDSAKLPAEGGVQTRIGDVLLSEQMLHYWFQQADQETRIRFMEWAERSMKRSGK